MEVFQRLCVKITRAAQGHSCGCLKIRSWKKLIWLQTFPATKMWKFRPERVQQLGNRDSLVHPTFTGFQGIHELLPEFRRFLQILQEKFSLSFLDFARHLWFFFSVFFLLFGSVAFIVFTLLICKTRLLVWLALIVSQENTESVTCLANLFTKHDNMTFLCCRDNRRKQCILQQIALGVMCWTIKSLSPSDSSVSSAFPWASLCSLSWASNSSFSASPSTCISGGTGGISTAMSLSSSASAANFASFALASFFNWQKKWVASSGCSFLTDCEW